MSLYIWNKATKDFQFLLLKIWLTLQNAVHFPRDLKYFDILL